MPSRGLFSPPYLQVCNLRGDNTTFNNRAATVACRQLGLPLPARVVSKGTFGTGANSIWLSSADCIGLEARLIDCPHAMFGDSGDCTPDDAANVECGYTPPPGKIAAQHLCLSCLSVQNSAYSTLPMVTIDRPHCSQAPAGRRDYRAVWTPGDHLQWHLGHGALQFLAMQKPCLCMAAWKRNDICSR